LLHTPEPEAQPSFLFGDNQFFEILTEVHVPPIECLCIARRFSFHSFRKDPASFGVEQKRRVLHFYSFIDHLILVRALKLTDAHVDL
jgi:hypothetical protein